MKTTQMSLNQWMDNKNGLYTRWNAISAINKNGIVTFADMWTELEIGGAIVALKF